MWWWGSCFLTLYVIPLAKSKFLQAVHIHLLWPPRVTIHTVLKATFNASFFVWSSNATAFSFALLVCYRRVTEMRKHFNFWLLQKRGSSASSSVVFHEKRSWSSFWRKRLFSWQFQSIKCFRANARIFEKQNLLFISSKKPKQTQDVAFRYQQQWNPQDRILWVFVRSSGCIQRLILKESLLWACRGDEGNLYDAEVPWTYSN